jgi:hypothetical protein
MSVFLRWLLIFVAGCLVGGIVVVTLMATGMLDRWLGGRATPVEWGRFNGTPKVELLGEGRVIKLLEDFVYVDARNKAWVAKKESIVDGASIPRIFWTLVGGPLDGKYRNASIVHDTACIERNQKWEDVHLMFYEACRCGGLDELQAKVLYWAVYHGGPRWNVVQEVREESRTTPDGRRVTIARAVTRALPIEPPKPPSEGDLKRVQEIIRSRNPSLDDLKKLEPRSER